MKLPFNQQNFNSLKDYVSENIPKISDEDIENSEIIVYRAKWNTIQYVHSVLKQKVLKHTRLITASTDSTSV